MKVCRNRKETLERVMEITHSSVLAGPVGQNKLKISEHVFKLRVYSEIYMCFNTHFNWLPC